MNRDENGNPVPGYTAGMTAALRALARARRGPVTDADRPPPSTFPKTPAAREALRLDAQKRKRLGQSA